MSSFGAFQNFRCWAFWVACASGAMMANGVHAELRRDAAEVARLETELALLDAVPVESPEFLSSFVRVQKILYRLERWDRLFAQAQFARARNLDVPPETAALEILALTKHCAWEAAESVARWAAHEAQSKGRSAEAIARAASLLNLHRHFPNAGIPTVWSALPSTAFQSQAYWPIQGEGHVVLDRVVHPKHLRVMVKKPSDDECARSREGS